MEQWILDGRSLIRQRSPDVVQTSDDVQRVAASGSSCFTSMLLTEQFCRVDDKGELHFRFDCDDDGHASPDGNWCVADDLSGVFGFVQQRAARRNAVAVYASIVADVKWFCNGRLVDESVNLEFVAGAGTVPQALEESVLGLDVEAPGVFLCDPAFAYREDGFARPSVEGAVVPPDSVVTLHVRIRSFENPLHPLERVARAEELKASGNGCVKDGNFGEALSLYRNALDKLSSGASPDRDVGMSVVERTEVDERVRALKPVLYHNMALCVMKLHPLSAEAAGQAVTYCTRALAVDPEYAKARFRRALAHIQKHDFQAAQADAEWLQAAPGTPAAEVDALMQQIAFERGGGKVSVAAV